MDWLDTFVVVWDDYYLQGVPLHWSLTSGTWAIIVYYLLRMWSGLSSLFSSSWAPVSWNSSLWVQVFLLTGTSPVVQNLPLKLCLVGLGGRLSCFRSKQAEILGAPFICPFYPSLPYCLVGLLYQASFHDIPLHRHLYLCSAYSKYHPLPLALHLLSIFPNPQWAPGFCRQVHETSTRCWLSQQCSP